MRVSQLDINPDQIEPLAKMFAAGASRDEIAEAFGVKPWTVTQWRKRADVQQKLLALIQARATQILSHTDARLLAVLTSKAELSVDQLLKIRDAFKIEGAPEDPHKAATEAMEELMRVASNDPKLAETLKGVLPNDAD